MKIEDVFTIVNRGTVVTGWVTGAPVHVDDSVTVVCQNGMQYAATVLGIEHYNQLYSSAEPGVAVGLLLSDVKEKDVNPGDLLIGQ
jgi:elongation factor Tu